VVKAPAAFTKPSSAHLACLRDASSARFVARMTSGRFYAGRAMLAADNTKTPSPASLRITTRSPCHWIGAASHTNTRATLILMMIQRSA
jgi:hypothetical protein